jgi:ABC-type antimicrobial peptide transport system permease subunit
MRLVLGRATILTVLGLALGIAAAVASTTVMATLLYGVTPRDAVTMVTAAVTLGTVALFAAWIPARRAAAVDPPPRAIASTSTSRSDGRVT